MKLLTIFNNNMHNNILKYNILSGYSLFKNGESPDCVIKTQLPIFIHEII